MTHSLPTILFVFLTRTPSSIQVFNLPETAMLSTISTLSCQRYSCPEISLHLPKMHSSFKVQLMPSLLLGLSGYSKHYCCPFTLYHSTWLKDWNSVSFHALFVSVCLEHGVKKDSESQRRKECHVSSVCQ